MMVMIEQSSGSARVVAGTMAFGKPAPAPAVFEPIFTDEGFTMFVALCVILASITLVLAFVEAPGSGASKTFLPQKALFPLWKDGFETWHIWVGIHGFDGSYGTTAS